MSDTIGGRDTITVRRTIHSAHRLPGFRGDCRFVHGASWRGTICVSCERGSPDDGLGRLAPSHLRRLLRRFDHRLIVAAGDGPLRVPGVFEPDGIVVIDGRSPSAENLAAALARDTVRCIRAHCPPRARRYTIQVTVAESEDDVFSMTIEAVV